MRLAALFLTTLLVPSALTAETRLLMGREEGCMWCARWDAEIGPIYRKTEVGQAAPLLETDIRGALPEGISLKSPLTFTPTFVVLDDGVEIARIEGYPGEDFFWPLVEQAVLPLSGN